MKFKMEVDADQANVILAGLLELPLKTSATTYQVVFAQLQEQQKKQPEPTAEDTDKTEE